MREPFERGANGVKVVRLSEANTRGGLCLAIFEDLTKRGTKRSLRCSLLSISDLLLGF
jgi:hypothetical protein